MNRSRIFRWITISLFLTTGGLLLIIFLTPYPYIKIIGNQLSRDGNLASLTPQLFYLLQFPGLSCGVVFVLIAISETIWSSKTEFFLSSVTPKIKISGHRFLTDTIKFITDLRLIQVTRGEQISIIVLVLTSLIVRLTFINRPIEYDEAYTLSEFARYPLKYILSDYSVVNNHVFHTILVHLSYQLFGDSLWVIRLPVLVSGLLMIPLIFLLGKGMYDRYTGLTAAAWAAVYPLLVIKTVSARGYALVATLTLVTYLLGVYLLKRNNLFAWVALGATTAIGIHTNPTMIYAFACLISWLCISRLFDLKYKSIPGKKFWCLNLLFTCLITFTLSILLYSPIILNKGFYIFSGNRVVDTLGLIEFTQTFPNKVSQVVIDWSIGIPFFVISILITGIILDICVPKGDPKFSTPIPVIIFGSLTIFLLLQRPNSLTRIWLWLLPLTLIFAASGIIHLAKYLMQKRNIHYNLLGTVSFIFIAAVWLSVLPFFIQEQKTGAIFVEDRDVENVVGFLEKHLTQQDVVVVSNCANARYWYYSDHFHLNRSSFREVKNRPFRHAYVLVYRTCKDKFDQPETAQSVMQEFGPDRNFLNQDTLHQIAHFGNVTVYDILANSKTIQDTYGKVK